MTYRELFHLHRWRPIRGCPGRFLLTGGPSQHSPQQIAGTAAPAPEYRLKSAPDPVSVLRIDGGGLISYRKPDGRWLHTLCDPEGFLRKLERLGLSASGSSGGVDPPGEP